LLPGGLRSNSRKTECGASSTLGDDRTSCTGARRLEEHRTGGAKQFPAGLVVRAAPFALRSNSRKTECGASSTLGDDRTSCTGARRLEEHRTGGAKQFPAGLVVRAAPLALRPVPVPFDIANCDIKFIASAPPRP
jgi:hypothetical protein